MFKNIYLNYTLAVLISIWAIVFGKHFFKTNANAHDNFPVVATTLAKYSNLTESVQAIGTLRAIQSVDISAPVSGTVDKIQFQSGQQVEEGQVLVMLSNQDLKARVLQDQAKYDAATEHYQRLDKLFKMKAVSAADMDNEVSTVKQAHAQLEYDQIQLDKTIIKAPFGGQVGIRQVNLGQFLSPGQPIVSMQDRSVLYVDFSLPERYINLFRLGDNVSIYPEDHKTLVFSATINALGAQIDPTTRNVAVQAKINNPDAHLIPGMFVNVQLNTKSENPMLIIPQTAITYNPKGSAVYLVKNGKAILKTVTIGERINDVATIVAGISPGDEVVTAGQLKLYDGADVHITMEPS